MIVYSLLLYIVQIIFNKDIYVNLAVIYVIILLYIYYKLWFNFDVDMLLIDKNDKNVKIINEHKNINTIVKTDDIYDAVEIVSQRLKLYKYKYFIDLYNNADTYYSTKEKYLSNQNNFYLARQLDIKDKSYRQRESNNYIQYKDYVDNHITQIVGIANQDLVNFKNQVKKEKETKINKEISEKKLKETKDELTKKENELYSKEAVKFLINRKINPKIKSDLRESYETTRNTLGNDISGIEGNINTLKEKKKSIKEEKDNYDYELSTRKKIMDTFSTPKTNPGRNQP